MTSKSLTEKILTLAGYTDTELSVRYLHAARALSAEVKDSDTVIWPNDQGGFAWNAVVKSGRNISAKGGRIICVTSSDFPGTPEL